MEIAIVGGTGLLGRQVSEELRARGHEVRVVSRNAATWRRATKTRAVLLPLPIPGALGRALREGAATTAHPDVRGVLTFESWATREQR